MVKRPKAVSPELYVWPTASMKEGEGTPGELFGRVVKHDPEGGQGGGGFLDVKSHEDGVQYRVFLNGPARSALEFAANQAEIGMEEVEGCDVVVEFAGWRKSKSTGRRYMSYAVGIQRSALEAIKKEQEAAQRESQ